MIKAMKERNRDIGRSAAAKKKSKRLPTYSNINVPVSVEWDAFEIVVSDLLRLNEGDILEMPKDIIGQTKVRVNKVTRFIGEVGIENNHVAVKVTENVHEIEES